MFATISVEPIIAVHVEHLTGTTERVAIYSAVVFSVTALGTVISGPWLGRLADHTGHLRVLSFSLAFATALLAVQAFMPNVWMFALLRFATGLALGGITPTVVATIRHLLPDTSVGLVLGYNVSAQYLGQVAGPVVAGIVGGLSGTATVFLGTAGATAIGLCAVLVIRRRIERIAAEPSQNGDLDVDIASGALSSDIDSRLQFADQSFGNRERRIGAAIIVGAGDVRGGGSVRDLLAAQSQPVIPTSSKHVLPRGPTSRL